MDSHDKGEYQKNYDWIKNLTKPTLELLSWN